VLILSTAIYTVFYPQPYVNEALRDVPIAVVDQDGTLASRELARRIDATPDVAVAMLRPDLPSAEREVLKRTISGVPSFSNTSSASCCTGDWSAPLNRYQGD